MLQALRPLRDSGAQNRFHRSCRLGGSSKRPLAAKSSEARQRCWKNVEQLPTLFLRAPNRQLPLIMKILIVSIGFLG